MSYTLIKEVMQTIINQDIDHKSRDKATGDLIQQWSAPMAEHFSQDEATTDKSGLILSPGLAQHCSQGFRRTWRYQYALYCAIRQQMTIKEQHGDKTPVRVFYPGCGPLAILAAPVMTLFSPGEVQLTVLDYHDRSIQSVKQLCQHFSLQRHVHEYVAADALSYQFPPGQQPDIIISEVLLSGLEHEGHVGINHHLLQQAPDAHLIPEQINLILKACNPAKEFQPLSGSKEDDRISLGQAFSYQRNTLQSIDADDLPIDVSRLNPDDDAHIFPGNSVWLPEDIPSHYHLFLFTELMLSEGNALQEYENGITCPVLYQPEAGYHPGRYLHFYYRTGRQPGLVASYHHE